MSIKVTSWVWEESRRAGTELLTLLALADFANDAGESYPSLTVLAHKVRLSVRQVCHILEMLEHAGEIRRQRSSGGRNRRTHYIISSRLNCEAGNSVTGNSVIQNTEAQRQETVLPTSHALNRHRTVNKKERAESDKPIPGLPLSTDQNGKKSKSARSAPRIPPELQPIVSRVVARINELAGTAYRFDSKIVMSGLMVRLEAGATEADCLAVVEDRWRDWCGNDEMRKHFNPETLFRESKFEKYVNQARMRGSSGLTHPRGLQEIPLP